MTDSEPRVIRWGILATGGIAVQFTKDILLDPKTRGVTNVKHTVVAAASSTSAARAGEFLKEVNAPDTAKAYGSYKELAEDPEVEIVYVATPHSHHYQNTMLCLLANKPVLCEKAFTTNAAQLAKLIEVAHERKLLLMEAVWTRYFPLSIYVRDQITQGRIGAVTRVQADLSWGNNPEVDFADGKSRMINANLAGGVLLDMGIYSLTWLFQTLFLTQPGPTTEKPKPTVLSAVNKYPSTGVDIQTTMLLTFPRVAGANLAEGADKSDVAAAAEPAHGIATASLRTGPPAGESTTPPCRMFGTKGEIQITPGLYRPTSIRILDATGKVVEEKTFTPPGGPGAGSGWYNGTPNEGEARGMHWEADEAAFALMEGRINGGRYLDLDESLLIMQVMDEVRKQGGVTYPESIESLEYPLEL